MRLFGVEPRSAEAGDGLRADRRTFSAERQGAYARWGFGQELGAWDRGQGHGRDPGGTEEIKLVGLLRIPGGSFGGLAFGMVPLSFGQEAFDKRGQISGIAVGAAEASPSQTSGTWTRS